MTLDNNMAGLGTVPPNMPECRSEPGPCNRTWMYTNPRREVVMAGVLTSHMPVSHTTQVSAAKSSFS